MALSPVAVRRGFAEDAFFRFRVAGVQVDVMVGETAFEFEVIARRRFVRMFGLRVPIATPEDLMLMKLVSGRTRDWQDARAVLLRHQRRLDWTYLSGWARTLTVQRGRGKVIERLARLRRLRDRD